MKKLFILTLFLLTIGAQISFGNDVPGYQPLSPIPGLGQVELATDGSESGRGLTLYIQNLYIWGVALTSGLAVLVIMWGGIGYMTSAGGSGVEEAKGRISAAIMGLLLALGSYIILQTINKDLLDTSFELKELDIKK